jgi:hypothetical protein
MVANGWQPTDPEVARVLDRLRAGEAALTDKINGLERSVRAAWEQGAVNRTEHRTRLWQAVLAVVTGLVLPLGVLGILAAIHLLTR